MQCILAVTVVFGVLPAIGNAADDLQTPSSAKISPSTRSVVNLVIVTDDDFLKDDSKSWCFRAIEKAMEKCHESRPATDIQIRTVFAGSPLNLNNNRPKTGPRRAVCFFCDSSDQLLGLCVGVPTAKQLLTLIEETDELSVIEALDKPITENAANDEKPVSKAFQAIRERVAARTIRHYRPLLDLIAPGQPIAIAGDLLQPPLEKDVAERYLLASPTDYERLVSIQQHAEAYRFWCDAILPCLYGRNVDEVWQELMPIVWHAEPWRIDAERELLSKWYGEAISKGPIVLELVWDKTLLGQQTKASDRAKANRTVQQAIDRDEENDAELEKAIFGIEYRKADLVDLAAILHQRGGSSLDLLNGSSKPPRWIIFENKTEKPVVLPKETRSRLMTFIKKIKRF